MAKLGAMSASSPQKFAFLTGVSTQFLEYGGHTLVGLGS